MVTKCVCERGVAAVVLALSLSFAGAALAQQSEMKRPKSLHPNDVAVPVDEATLNVQYATLAAMALTDVDYNENNLIRYIKGRTGLKVANHKELKGGDVAADLAKVLKPMLLTTGTEVFTVQRSTPSADAGTRHIRLTQAIASLPVMAGSLILEVREDTGEIVQLASSVIPDRGLPRKPKITAEKAKQLAASYLEGAGWAEPKSVVTNGEPELAYFAGTAQARKPALVWAVKVDFLTADQPPPARPGGMPMTWQVFIDALDGAYLGQLSATADAPQVSVLCKQYKHAHGSVSKWTYVSVRRRPIPLRPDSHDGL